MDLFADLCLIDYGFEWMRVARLDDITCWQHQKSVS